MLCDITLLAEFIYCAVFWDLWFYDFMIMFNLLVVQAFLNWVNAVNGAFYNFMTENNDFNIALCIFKLSTQHMVQT